MKILLCCAGGFSSSIVMKKMAQYGESIGEEIIIKAVGTGGVEDELSEGGYQVLLTAPQVRNRFKSLEETASQFNVPCAAMAPQDYAIANCEHIYKQVKDLIG